MLSGIWWVSLMLCAGGVGIMAALIVLRFVRRRRHQREQAAMRTLSRELVLWLGEPAHDLGELRAAARSQPLLVQQLVLRTADLLRGDEHTRLVLLAQELGTQDRLVETMKRGRPARRRHAAEALAMFDSDAAAAALYSGLNDANPEVRMAAARSLAAMGRPVPVRELMADPATFGDSGLMQDLFDKLAMHQPDDLMAMLADESAAEGARAAAARAVAAAGRFDALPLLLAMASSPRGPLRQAAAVALGEAAHPRVAPTLQTLLADGSWPVRAAAAEACGRVGAPTLVSGLEQALADENWWVRLRAADALRCFGSAGEAVLSRVASGPVSPAQNAAALSVAVPQEAS